MMTRSRKRRATRSSTESADGEKTPSSQDSAETPDSQWEASSGETDEDDVLVDIVEQISQPLWLIARALAKLADVSISDLQREDDDGSEFSTATE